MRAICIVLAVVAFAAPAAFAQSSYKTSTTVFDLQQQLSPIQLESNVIYVSGTGVRLANSATSGAAGFYGTDAPFGVNNVVCSWNLDMPPGTGFRTEVRAYNGTWTSWFEIARQGTIPGGITRVKGSTTNGIEDDTLMLPSLHSRIEYRVTLYTNAVGVTPTLRLMSVCYADSSTPIPYVPLPDPGYTTSLAVPFRSQNWSTVDPGSICGPTSMSMAMAYNGCFLSTEYIVTEEYDSYNQMYGNWPFIAQEAAKYGFKSYYSRSNGQQPLRDHLAQGYPVEFGMAYSAGELTHSPISSTAGHLVLVVGIDANGDYICNDPAGSTSTWDHVVYHKDDIANVWLGHGGTTIPCIPNNVYWRYPYFMYKSSDPVAINKTGQMEMFAKGATGKVYRARQVLANGSWPAWTDMGGTAACDPVAVMNRNGGCSVFARFTDGNLYYASQSDGPNGSWSGWIGLGAIAGKPAVGKSPDGRLDVFCRMADGSIGHRWQDYSGGYQAWTSLGGNVTSDPVVALNWEGREEVFVRGTDNQLYHKWQLNDGTWSGWSSLGGTLGGDPVMGKTFDGRLEVYCRFSDGTIRRNWQTGLLVGTSWNGWTSLGGSAVSNPALGRRPGTIVMNVGYNQEVFYCDSAGQVWHKYQTSTDGSFSAWESFGGASIGGVTVGHNDDGTLQVFIPLSDGFLWCKSQTGGGAGGGQPGWSSWAKCSSQYFGDTTPPVISVNVTSKLAVFGDNVSILAFVTDNMGVASVTANGVGLSKGGGTVWAGLVPASSELGSHTVNVEARDVFDNVATNSSGSYTTTSVMALTNRAAWDSVTIASLSKYLYAVCGRVTVVDMRHFRVDDGSGKPIDVYATGHGLTDGRFVRVRGTLSRYSSEMRLESTVPRITILN
jgi:hypothetical protein